MIILHCQLLIRRTIERKVFMGTVDFEWEEIVVQVTGRGKYSRKSDRIWLTAKNSTKKDDRLNTINISAAICEKAGWRNGIRVNLARQGNSLFRLSPSSVGLYEPRQTSSKVRSMRLTNLYLVAELRPHINGTEFDAWVDGDTIYFKPSK